MGFEHLVNSGIGNIELIEEMYARFLENPNSVGASWRVSFQGMEGDAPAESGSVQVTAPPPTGTPLPERTAVVDREAPSDLRVYNLIDAYRTYGHLMAKINPISTQNIQEPPQLQLDHLGFSSDELLIHFPTCGLLEEASAPLEKIIDTLREIYCDKIGIEYMGLQNPEMEKWIQERIEPSRFKFPLTIDQKRMILQHLNKSELFEVFLHTKYTGQKRFSLEGGETLIPVLASIIETGVQLELEDFLIGMAHRGRLNVLTNIMEKSYADIFSEFEEGYIPVSFEGSGDVKYHKGFVSVLQADNGKSINVILAPNPSHLEAVDPVVEGMSYAKQILKHDDVEKKKVTPILVHGDAALAGQGVIYETLQMYGLKGYSTGGTVHVVINNQIGFTTLPGDGRSTTYCTDIARTFDAPVFHVNGEDPEACVMATNLAVEIRQKFHCDVFIDLNCYRKYGHNEADEPAFTQPLEYQIIRQKKPIREIYRDDLIHQGVLEKQMAESLEAEFKEALQEELVRIREPVPEVKVPEPIHVPTEKEIFIQVDTSVSEKVLQNVGKKITTVPEGLTIHRKLQSLLKDRRAMILGEKPIDWGMGEHLAFGTLLVEGTPVRLAGQDCRRGTFSHRHAVWTDQKTGHAYYPLQHLSKEQGRFDALNSPLSEYGCLGFEFGYATTYPDSLVIWEAQFGDFSNGAQIIIDQFIATAEQKWGQKNGLTLFLPHGYEGQGPEHSSGRIERFLALCGNDNMQIVDASTPAQLFHLIRRQVHSPRLKPLIVFTPKGLLRHPDCISEIKDFTGGHFQEILDDPSPAKKTKRLVLCTGRIYYELAAAREKLEVNDMTILRVEQLYPLYIERLQALFDQYKGFKECIWVQEEPRNMGAWDYIRAHLMRALPKGVKLKGMGRPRSASPAAGSYALHKKEHMALMNELFGKE